MDCSLPNSSVHGIFLGKNTRVGCHASIQKIFPTQELNPHLLHCRQILYCWAIPGELLWEFVMWKSLSRVWFFVTPWTKQSMEFSRPKYWSGKPFPSPGDLPNPGIEPRSPTFQVDSLPAQPPGKSLVAAKYIQQIWKTQQWPQGWKRSVFIPIPKQGNASECSNYCTIAFISHEQDHAQNSPSQASTVCEPRNSRCTSWI